MAAKIKETYENIIQRIREMFDENEVITVEGLADAISSVETGEVEFVLVPPAVLVELSGVRTDTAGMGYINHNYDVTITMLVVVESLPDKKAAFSQALDIGERIIDGFVQSPPAGLLNVSNAEFNLAFAGNGFVGLTVSFESKIGG